MDRETDPERVCIEALETARHGAPRLLTLRTRSGEGRVHLVRRLARAARDRGWVPLAASRLCRLARRQAVASTGGGARLRSLMSRSLLIFEDHRGLDEAIAALSLCGRPTATPHVLVAWEDDRASPECWARRAAADHQVWPLAVRESAWVFAEQPDLGRAVTACDEAAARLAVLSARVSAPGADARHALQLARLLLRRGQSFEARGWLARVSIDPVLGHERLALVADIDTASQQAAGTALRERVGAGPPAHAGRDRMVDDFVGVLQLCQDIEDERVALSRVGAYVRERLQAASVAFVVREGPGARTIASSGLEQSTLDAALTAIESGCSVARGIDDGPSESAAPVRYAADVIGALWVRWSAGMPVSGVDASALLGVAAIAAAPSLRGVLDRERPAPDAVVPELVGASPAIRAVREAVVRAARSPFPVLIEGESGVGKELVARAIHAGGVRRDRRFSAINCAALVDDLVEAELFGHMRGAFTGAQTDRAGLFEDASGGTLFLDEVAELGARVQAKLLRTLQEGEVRRIGEAHTRRVDVRVVAATNRPLAAEVSSGRFRRDLWYRLDVIRIAIPPVRERLEDIPLLVRHAWSDLAARTGSRAVLSASAVAALSAYDWPGNVRELQNVLASILVSAPRRGVLGPSMLPAHVARAAALAPASTLVVARRQFETRFVRAALARANGRPSVAARELGLSRQGLAKILVRLGLSEPASASREARGAHVE